MITPTGMTQAAYTEAILSGAPQHVRMTFDNGVVLGDQDIEANWLTLMDILNGDTDLTIGRAVCKELSLNLLSGDRMEGVRWNHEFTLEMGVDVVESGVTVTKWVQVGIFQGTRPDKIHYVDVISFTAHDRMVRFDVDIDPYLNGLTWPVSFSDLLEGLCDYCGVEYVAGDELQNIMSRTFENTLSGKGLTGTSLLALMAEACGCYAKITPEGKLRMTWFSEAAYEVDADHEFAVDAYDIGSGMTWAEIGNYSWQDASQWTWADVGGYQAVFAVHGLSSRMTVDDIGVNYGSKAGNLYVIVDNPFLVITNDTDGKTYVKPLYERLKAFGGYLPANIECVGNWLVEAGDIITVDVHGESVRMPIFCRTMVWNGACTDVYEATGSMERKAYSRENQQKLTEGGKFHEFRLNIDTLYSAIQDAEGNISTLQQVAEQIVLSLADKYDKISGITITAAGIDVSGSQYVKIASGGVFEVSSENFLVDSENGIFNTGAVTVNSDYILIRNEGETIMPSYLFIGRNTPNSRIDTEHSDEHIEVSANTITFKFLHWNDYVPSDNTRGLVSLSYEPNTQTIELYTSKIFGGENFTLGTRANPVDKIFVDEVYAGTFKENYLATRTLEIDGAKVVFSDASWFLSQELAGGYTVFTCSASSYTDHHGVALTSDGSLIPYYTDSQNPSYINELGSSSAYWQAGYISSVYAEDVTVHPTSNGYGIKLYYDATNGCVINFKSGEAMITSSNINTKIYRNVSGVNKGFMVNINGNLMAYASSGTEPTIGTSTSPWPAVYAGKLIGEYRESSSATRKLSISGDTIKFSNDGTQGMYISGKVESNRAVLMCSRSDFTDHHGVVLSWGGDLIPYASNGISYSNTIGTSSVRWMYGYFNYLDTAYTVSSSSKSVKHDIRMMDEVGDRLDRLKPVTFIYNRDEQNRKRYGLIWEETVGILPDICIGEIAGPDADKAINYVDLVPILLKEIQELRKRVKDMEVKTA